MRSIARGFSVVSFVCLLAFPAFADQKIRFGLQSVNPTGDFVEQDSNDRIVVEADAAVGVFFEYERPLAGRAAIFGNVSFQTHDLDETDTDLISNTTTEATIAEVDVIPVEVGVNFYVVENDRISLYVGPKIAYVIFGDAELNQTIFPGDPDVPIDEEFGFGVNFGIDAPLGDGGWMFSGGLQYLKFAAQTEGSSSEIDIDPIVLKVGLGRRF